MFVTKPMDKGGANEVKKNCRNESDGRWYCINCEGSFRRLEAAEMHNELNPRHKIVWDCDEHGFETCTPYDPSASQLE